jgi:hypothetical protein
MSSNLGTYEASYRTLNIILDSSVLSRNFLQGAPKVQNATNSPSCKLIDRPNMNSLELLLPPTSQTLLPRSSPSTRLLEDASAAIIRAFSLTPQNNTSYAYLAPNHLTEHPGDCKMIDGPLYSRDELIFGRANLKARNPRLKAEVTDVVSNVNEACGRAMVWVSSLLEDFQPEMKRRQSVARMEWRRTKEEGWRCVKTTFVHGFFL